MGCNQSKAADNAVVAQPSSKVDPPKPTPSTSVLKKSAEILEPTQTNTNASPTASKDVGPPCEEVSIPSDFSMETPVEAMDEVAVVVEAPSDEETKPVAEEATKEATAKTEIPMTQVVAKVEELAVKDTTTYDDAVKELEDALLPRSVDESRSFSGHEGAVEELEESLRRLRCFDTTNDKPEEKVEATKPTPVEEVVSIEPVASLEEEATGNVAPAPADDGPKENTPQARTCAKCDAVEKAPGAFKTCAKCRDVYYCNKTCQKAHTKVHKKTCCKTESKKNHLGSSNNATLNQIQAN